MEAMHASPCLEAKGLINHTRHCNFIVTKAVWRDMNVITFLFLFYILSSLSGGLKQ